MQQGIPVFFRAMVHGRGKVGGGVVHEQVQPRMICQHGACQRVALPGVNELRPVAAAGIRALRVEGLFQLRRFRRGAAVVQGNAAGAVMFFRHAAQPLSHRGGDEAIKSLREDGLEPMAVSSLASLIGTGQDVEACSSLDELSKVFDPQKVSRSNAKFDAGDLDGLNEKLLHDMAYDVAAPRLAQKGWDLGEAFWHAVRANISRFDDVAVWHQVVSGDVDAAEMDDDDKAFVAGALQHLPDEPWDDEIWSTWTGILKGETGRKGRALFMPLRKALTGQGHGPDMKEMLPLIGRANTVRRLS